MVGAFAGLGRAVACCMLGLILAFAATAVNAGTVGYTYDALGRLTGVSYPDGKVVQYGYDHAGNRTLYSVTCATCVLITTTSLPAPVLGMAYSQTIATVGGTAPVALSVAAGTLPAGLTLNPTTGAIAGTPTVPGPYSFTIKALDAAGTSATQTYSGTVATNLAITTASLPPPLLSQAYSQTVATSGGLAPITLSVFSGVLPTGLSLASGGAITGTPSAAGTFNFTVRAIDANSTHADQAYSETVAAALAITSNTLPTPVLTTAYSQSVATSGGTAPITFSVFSGALPAGLSLTAASGLISGTPSAAGAYSFTIKATDTNSVTASQAYSGTIAALPTITTATLPVPVLTNAYSQTVATSGGAAPITFSVSAGTLPTGLSLTASSGLISGTPTTAGAYSFTIKATDANAKFATQAYSGTITANVVITTTTLPVPVLTNAYSQTIATTGGAAPITFSISVGSLPAGLSLNTSTGVIGGTPTASGAYSFTIKAADTSGVFATQAYSGTIVAAVAITTATLPTPALSTAYSQTIAASGGTTPITFSVSVGTLPAGLALTASSGLISGTPTTAGAYSFTIKATDANAKFATQAYSGTISANTAPIANPVSATVNYNSSSNPITLNITGGAATGVAVSTTPGHGAATAAGTSITYTPTSGYAGSDTFQYTATNSVGTSSPATVSITVSIANGTVLYTNSTGGSWSYTIPSGVSFVDLEIWGGGGGGSGGTTTPAANGYGGGGGGYVKKHVSVTAGSSFSGLVGGIANPGKLGSTSQSPGATGSATTANSSLFSPLSANPGGGGSTTNGAGGTTSGPGDVTTNGSPGSGNSGGSAGNGAGPATPPVMNGTSPGGGGAGGGTGHAMGGAGAAGRAQITARTS